MNKLALVLIAAAMALAGCATTETGVCTRYNTGGGELGEDEFYAATFEAWDTDGDDRLSEDEVLDGFDDAPFAAWGRSFADWFSEHDAEYLTRDEFASGWETLGAFDGWDRDGDGSLSEIECDNVGSGVPGEPATEGS